MIGDRKSDFLAAKKSKISFFYRQKNFFKKVSKSYLMCGLYFSQSSFEVKQININKIFNLINAEIKNKNFTDLLII